VNLSWKVSEVALLYYIWSQGFRSGSFNRPFSTPTESPLAPGPGSWQAQARAHGGWNLPLSYAPDNLTNNEVGWKTAWFDHRWSGTARSIRRTGFTLRSSRTTSVVIWSSRARSIAATTGCAAPRRPWLHTFSMRSRSEVGAAWNHSELFKEAPFFWADGTPIDFGTLRSSTGERLANPAGSSLAGAPPFQGNIRARYEFSRDGYQMFAQIGATHQAHSFASNDRPTLDALGNSAAYDLPSFTVYDGVIGVGKDAWLAEIYGQTLTDTRAELYANYKEWYKAITVNRPRTIGVCLSYRFGGR
jgi:iron complex outermembrane recepter protein